MTYDPCPRPGHLPQRLTITSWDFSWYVRTGPGEPFEDLDRAFAEAVDRGYNTVRICAMPYLLFGSGLDTAALQLGPLGTTTAACPLVRRGRPTIIDAGPSSWPCSRRLSGTTATSSCPPGSTSKAPPSQTTPAGARH